MNELSPPDAAVTPADADETSAGVPVHWQNARDVIMASAGHWQSGRRKTVSMPGYVEPKSFCDAVLAKALTDRAFLDPIERAEFFDWAIEQKGTRALLPVVAAHDLLARGAVADAIHHLDLALRIDQEDLYAQELWFAAQGTPIQPVDTEKRMCLNPFERAESASRNRLMFCCPAWLPVPFGQIEDGSVEEVWNSTAAQDIRASIHDGSYRYCSRMHCPMFTADDMPHVADIKNAEMKEVHETKATVLPPRIGRINLSHDRSCNLSCPSCRTDLIIADRAASRKLNELAENTLLPLIRAARRVKITGSGDPFASRHYRWIIQQLTAEQDGPIIDLQTNGLLLERSWEPLGLAGSGRVDTVLVSTDAATPETYRVVRRGGEYDDLLRNLEYLSELRASGEVRYVRVDFVVQALNFREMPAAARLSNDLGFDRIKFQMLRSWNTWSPEEFSRQHVGHPTHPEYQDLLAVLRDPILHGPKVAYSGFYGAAADAPSDVLADGSS